MLGSSTGERPGSCRPCSFVAHGTGVPPHGILAHGILHQPWGYSILWVTILTHLDWAGAAAFLCLRCGFQTQRVLSPSILSIYSVAFPQLRHVGMIDGAGVLRDLLTVWVA